MKYLLTLFLFLSCSTALAGPKFNFNFGVDRYEYRYAPPRYIERTYVYRDQYGQLREYRVIERIPERNLWHYGPEFGFQFRGR